jgi:ABC-type lipoprotein export system ATPase subunit
MACTAPLLELSGVSKKFESPGASNSIEVLRDVSLRIAGKESLAIVGPSGSGKSTLLNIIAALEKPTCGTVRFEGETISDFTPSQMAAFRNRHIGLIFQTHFLLPQCSVWENVLVPTLASKEPQRSQAPNDSVESRATRLLTRVGLGQRIHHRPSELSGGEKQRVAVVRALINRPRLLLADEPTGSLDRASAERLGELLTELNREEDVALIVVTHAPGLAQRMGHTLELNDGRLQR